MDKLYNNFVIQQNNVNRPKPAQPAQKNQSQGTSFNQIFTELEQASDIQFSKHANMRLVARNINFSPEQMQRLENGINDAKSKGINDSLVLVDNVALVVNVDSRTVITALHKDQKNIFTNIDGAVIV